MEDTDRQEIITTLGRYQTERFAVVDGAHFDDLAVGLKGFHLEGEPLFLDDMGDGTSLSGPWLVELPDWEAANRVLSLIGDLPAAVFWCWGDGKENLYKHLRRLNMVEIPADNFNATHPAYDKVLFRHADPNVMANALSVLYENQYAKVLDNVGKLIMFASDFGGLRVAPSPANAVDVPKGMLRFEIGQYTELEINYTLQLKTRALREFPQKLDLPLTEARNQIADAYDRADQYGLETKDQVWEFIELDIKYGQRFELTRKYTRVLDELTDQHSSPDVRIHCASTEIEVILKGWY